MHSRECWWCLKLFQYDGEQFRDVDCPHCNTMNSIYNPAVYQPNTEEEMINYGDEKYQGKFVYLPTMGKTETFEIAVISEVQSDNPKFNFNEKVPVMANGIQVVDDDGEAVYKDKDLGYHIEAKLTNGKILSVTSMSAFIQVFKKNEIQDGDKVKIFHKDKGIWEVEKL